MRLLEAPLLFEFAFVDVQKRKRLIAGHIDVRKTIFVEVSRQHPKRVVALRLGNA
jgi:hypothetical protein